MSLLRVQIVSSFVCVLFPAAAMIGCGGGGSSSSGDPVALCMQSCDKVISLCYADAGATGTNFQGQCKSGCMNANTMSSKTTCTNSDAIISAYKACLNKTTCNDLMTCESMLPQCQGGSTTGGSSGTTGGSSGTTGGTGTTSGGTCADLLACCNKASANLKSPCMTAYTSAMPSGDSVCGAVLSGIKASYCP